MKPVLRFRFQIVYLSSKLCTINNVVYALRFQEDEKKKTESKHKLISASFLSRRNVTYLNFFDEGYVGNDNFLEGVLSPVMMRRVELRRVVVRRLVGV